MFRRAEDVADENRNPYQLYRFVPGSTEGYETIFIGQFYAADDGCDHQDLYWLISLKPSP